jgi:hypothetical protein
MAESVYMTSSAETALPRTPLGSPASQGRGQAVSGPPGRGCRPRGLA